LATRLVQNHRAAWIIRSPVYDMLYYATPWPWPRANVQKFFGSFFQKEQERKRYFSMMWEQTG
jgi:hypothetical protein